MYTARVTSHGKLNVAKLKHETFAVCGQLLCAIHHRFLRENLQLLGKRHPLPLVLKSKCSHRPMAVVQQVSDMLYNMLKV